MKAILEFDLPQEQVEFFHATKALTMMVAIQDIFNEVFKKRWDNEIPEEELNLSHVELVEKMRDEAWEIIEGANLAEFLC